MIEFTLSPGHILSANGREHWRVKAYRTSLIRVTAGWVYRAAGSPRYTTRVHCVCTVTYPDRRRRDVHNLLPTCKAAIDGLVTDMGMLPDDNDKWLVGPDMRASGQPSTDGLYHFRFEFTPVTPERKEEDSAAHPHDQA